MAVYWMAGIGERDGEILATLTKIWHLRPPSSLQAKEDKKMAWVRCRLTIVMQVMERSR
jgi:hypothetical protein